MQFRPYNLSTWVSFHVEKFIGRLFRRNTPQLSESDFLTEAAESWKEYDWQSRSYDHWLDDYAVDAPKIKALENRGSLTISACAGSAVVGNKRTLIYHRPYCEWAEEMFSHNECHFRSSQEALAANYRPCWVCRPHE